jgi:quercetin dioxygenase-like cupin family protein
MTSDYNFIPFLPAQLPDIPPDSIVSRTLLDDEQSKVILFGFAAGQELSEHTAAMPAQLYFVEGEAELSLGEAEFVTQAGTWVQMAPRLPHSICAKTHLVMLLVMLKNSA